jgi:L-lactate dehydrogenase (cytochrome)
LKALALGAQLVFVGRPFLYAAAIGDEAGVLHAIDILSTEINRNMGLLGINTLAEMRPELLFRLKGEKQTLYPSSIGAEHATT